MLSFYLFISLSSYDLIPTSPLLQLEAGRNLKHLLRVLSASSPFFERFSGLVTQLTILTKLELRNLNHDIEG